MDPRNGYRRTMNAITLALVFSITVILSGCTTVVQPIEHYTTTDGNMSVTFPASWDVADDVVSDGSTVLLLESGNGVVSDDIDSTPSGLMIVLLPGFFVEPDGRQVPVSAIEIIDIMYMDQMSREGVELGAVDTVILDDGTFLDRFFVSDGMSDALFYAYQLDDNIVVSALAVSQPGNDIHQTVEQILSSLTVNSDSDSYVENAKAIMGFD